MKIDEACVGCIVNQSFKVAQAINANKQLSLALTSKVEEMSKTFSYDQTPPKIAADVYEMMAQIANKKDLYSEVKEHSTQKALSFVPALKKRLLQSDNKLLTATKIAVAGNVIDLAAEVEFDLYEELENIFHIDFSHNDFDKFQLALENAKTVLVIGDNVGEHIFDHLFIETLKELYLDKEFSYMVRGNPIINDVTIKEAKEAGFDKLCNLMDSGVNTPGFTYDRATDEAKKLFDNVDLIISKGMGNYECMSPVQRENICFLLKVKCNVVANSLGKNVGDIICKLS
jgi:damage-control phosphatase, subfamily I